MSLLSVSKSELKCLRVFRLTLISKMSKILQIRCFQEQENKNIRSFLKFSKSKLLGEASNQIKIIIQVMKGSQTIFAGAVEKLTNSKYKPPTEIRWGSLFYSSENFLTKHEEHGEELKKLIEETGLEYLTTNEQNEISRRLFKGETLRNIFLIYIQFLLIIYT
jgi:hypothetical protein